ncbi:unnamed protein product, partial [Amoebophrya sp. A120]
IPPREKTPKPGTQKRQRQEIAKAENGRNLGKQALQRVRGCGRISADGEEKNRARREFTERQNKQKPRETAREGDPVKKEDAKTRNTKAAT